MDLMQEIIARAKANKQRIVLPEGTEERTLKALVHRTRPAMCCVPLCRLSRLLRV